MSASAFLRLLWLPVLFLAPAQAADEAPAAGRDAAHRHGAPTTARPGAPFELLHAERIEDRGGIPHYRTVLTSPVQHIDRIYRSMEGPITQTGFRLDPKAAPELLWLVGYDATIVDAAGKDTLSQEFMCHSSVATHRERYGRLVPTSLGPKEGRLFTLAQGQRRVRFPDGFGIPFLSNQRLELQAQVLNHNRADERFDVRQRVSIEFVRDRDLVAPMVALTLTGASGMKLVDGEGGYFGLASGEADPELHGPGCSIGTAAAGHEIKDGAGRTFTAHWIVEPGREVNHTLVTEQLKLPYDTTIHYVAVHLHPYAVSISLRDLTTGETVLHANGRSARDRIALEEVESVSSAEGIALHADHEYEIVSVYENSTPVDQDAMASLYLYVRVGDVDVTAIRARATRAARAAERPRGGR